jgi:hypothetical protein
VSARGASGVLEDVSGRKDSRLTCCQTNILPARYPNLFPGGLKHVLIVLKKSTISESELERDPYQRRCSPRIGRVQRSHSTRVVWVAIEIHLYQRQH